MTRARAVVWASSLLLAALGCNSKGPSNGNMVPMPPNGGSSGSGHMPSGTVSISIDNPTADPQKRFAPSSLVDVSVHASVVDGTDYIDGTSVKVAITAQGDAQVVETGQLVIDAGDHYVGRVSLGDLEPGLYTLTVTARSSGGATGETAVDFAIDTGPMIAVNSPAQGGSYKGMLTIEVVASDPLVGLMAPPTALVGSIAVPLTEAGVLDTFRGTIDFNAYEPPLVGEQLLVVTAINNEGRRIEMQVIFTIDIEGPTIVNTTPLPGVVTGGIIGISATIGDPAGLLESSIIAIIGDQAGVPLFDIPLKPLGAGVYGALFDTARLTRCPDPPTVGPCVVNPTISFRASDQIGNETVVAYLFSIDNRGPVSDLDPANVRFIRKDGFCSREFDPLARNLFPGDMPNDATYVPQAFDLRARIQDDGNTPTGIKEVPLAGTDPNATAVFLLNDETQPLIVDIDGDGTCDVINPKLVPTTEPPTQNNQVLKVRLSPVPKQGEADYRPDGNVALDCPYPATANAPEFLCDTGQPYAAMSYDHGKPAIWSVEPIEPIKWCMGGQFDTRANHIDDNSWACIAVQSADLNGNVSVSRALRVFVHYNGADARQAVRAADGAPPTCTGSYNKATDTVTPGPCKARGFDRVDYCYNGDAPYFYCNELGCPGF